MKHVKEHIELYILLPIVLAGLFGVILAFRLEINNASLRARCNSLEGKYASPSGDCWKDGKKI